MTDIVQTIANELKNYTKPRSDFEFETFFLGQYPTPARQMIAVMEEILRISTTITALENEHQLANVNKNLKQLTNWYEGFDAKERADILKNFENEEPEYWVNVLGRRAALEVLSQKQASVETMEHMIKLPRELFETATSVCNDYIHMITDIIKNVEEKLDNPVLGVAFDS